MPFTLYMLGVVFVSVGLGLINVPLGVVALGVGLVFAGFLRALANTHK